MNIDQSGARRAYRAQGSTPGIAQFTRFLISTSYALPIHSAMAITTT